MDAVARFRIASEENDMARLVSTLSPAAELVSPLSNRMVFRGRDDVVVLLAAVYGTVRDLRWREEVGDGDVRIVVGDCRIGPLRMSDAMVLDLASDGQIRRIRPHLRPWLPLSLFALSLSPKLVRHPAVLRRALLVG